MADLQVGQHSAAHEDGDLLNNLDAGVPRLPALLALAHCLQERQQGGDAQGRRHHTKCTRCCIPHVPVHTTKAYMNPTTSLASFGMTDTAIL